MRLLSACSWSWQSTVTRGHKCPPYIQAICISRECYLLHTIDYRRAGTRCPRCCKYTMRSLRLICGGYTRAQVPAYIQVICISRECHLLHTQLIIVGRALVARDAANTRCAPYGLIMRGLYAMLATAGLRFVGYGLLCAGINACPTLRPFQGAATESVFALRVAKTYCTD